MLINIVLDIVSPDSLCSVLRLCPNMEMSERAMFALSDCDLCLTLVVLTRRSLGKNATELQAASFLRTVCQSHPNALSKCESFTQRHGNQILGLLGKEMTAKETCEKADLCVKDRRDSASADGCLLSEEHVELNIEVNFTRRTFSFSFHCKLPVSHLKPDGLMMV
ncbi:hypothetical protein MHYP_G00188620 [Metynnis hypsauchen]